MIVDTTTCAQFANPEQPFILALKTGENLFQALLQCAKKMNLKSASISGLGGLDNVSVAYYNLETQQYQTKVFEPMHELISMNGNIAFFEGQHFIHIHAALGTHDYSVIGGHIMDATVNPSGEITIIPLSGTIQRAFDSQTGLKLMCPIASRQS